MIKGKNYLFLIQIKTGNECNQTVKSAFIPSSFYILYLRFLHIFTNIRYSKILKYSRLYYFTKHICLNIALIQN